MTFTILSSIFASKMRFIACILSIYILALTATPCIDRPEEPTVQKMEITQSQGNHQHQKDADHCSPLCTCNCCASPVIQQDFTIQFNSFSFIQGCFYPEYASEFVSCYSGSIWQPPQLS